MGSGIGVISCRCLHKPLGLSQTGNFALSSIEHLFIHINYRVDYFNN